MVKGRQYKCALCDRVYNEIEDRIDCEIRCLQKHKEEENRKAQIKKAQEREARRKEVEEAMTRADELVDKYVQDYGMYCECDGNCGCGCDCECDSEPAYSIYEILENFFK